MTEERLRDLYGRALAEDRARPRGEAHVPPDAILALVRREGAEEERLRVLNHVMSCERCRQSFELLKSVESAGAVVTRESGAGDVARPAAATGDEGDAGVVPIESRRRWRVLTLALAASIILVVGIGVLTRIQISRQAEPERGGADVVTLLSPAEAVAADAPLVFAWRPLAGARSYELQVLDTQGAVQYRTTTKDTLLTLVGLLRPGEHRWLVRARVSGGEVLSPARPLRIR